LPVFQSVRYSGYSQSEQNANKNTSKRVSDMIIIKTTQTKNDAMATVQMPVNKPVKYLLNACEIPVKSYRVVNS